MSQNTTSTPTFDALAKWIAASPGRIEAQDREAARQEKQEHAARQRRESQRVQKGIRSRLATKFPNIPKVEPMWRVLMAFDPNRSYERTDFEAIVPDYPTAYTERMAVELMRQGMMVSAKPNAELRRTAWALTPAGVRWRSELVDRRKAGDFIPSRHMAGKAFARDGVVAMIGLSEEECRTTGRAPNGHFLPAAKR